MKIYLIVCLYVQIAENRFGTRCAVMVLQICKKARISGLFGRFLPWVAVYKTLKTADFCGFYEIYS